MTTRGCVMADVIIEISFYTIFVYEPKPCLFDQTKGMQLHTILLIYLIFTISLPQECFFPYLEHVSGILLFPSSVILILYLFE